MSLTPHDRLIVALDVPSTRDAEQLVATLGDTVSFYKVGLELTYAGGLEFARDLVKSGKQVFLDLKLHDIPNTVQKATEQIAGLGMTYLTIHAFPQTMKAAMAGKAGSDLKLLAVTVMTSYDNQDLIEAGYDKTVTDLVTLRALAADRIGIDGLILSPEEVGAMRALLGPRMTLITPGIRPASAAVGDQKRVMTPLKAISAGADRLVIGRPVTQNPDPKAAAEAILAEIRAATQQ